MAPGKRSRRNQKEVPSHESLESQGSPAYVDKLPYGLLSLIISLLPLEEAIATSVLSSQWKNLWRSMPHLDIDPVEVGRRQRGLKKSSEVTDPVDEAFLYSIPVIDRLLKSHKGNLTSLRILHDPNIVLFSKHLIRWIDYLKKKKQLQKLVLSNVVIMEPNQNDPFIFPQQFFCSNSLHTLELANYNLKDATPFQGCVNLVKLVLRSVMIMDGTFSEMLYYCTSLNHLTIKFCFGLTNLEIYKGILKHLEIEYLTVSEFKLITEGLEFLAINNLSCSSGNVVIYCPGIRVLRAYSRNDGWVSKDIVNFLVHRKILDQCAGLLVIDSSKYLLSREPRGNHMENLRELSFSFDLNDVKLKVFLRFIFSTSAYLYKLEIENKPTPLELVNSLQPEKISWEMMELYDCVSRQLKIVRVKGFTAKHLEIEFVKYLIKNASKMDNLVIEFDSRPEKEVSAAMELLAVPRASPCACVTIKPGRDGEEDTNSDDSEYPFALLF